jgi:hypothetical protein
MFINGFGSWLDWRLQDRVLHSRGRILLPCRSPELCIGSTVHCPMPKALYKNGSCGGSVYPTHSALSYQLALSQHEPVRSAIRVRFKSSFGVRPQLSVISHCLTERCSFSSYDFQNMEEALPDGDLNSRGPRQTGRRPVGPTCTDGYHP